MNPTTTQDCRPKAALQQQAQILLSGLLGIGFFLGYTSLIFLFAWSVDTSPTFRAATGFALTNLVLPGLILIIIGSLISILLYAIFKPTIHLGLCWLQRRQARRKGPGAD